MSEQSEPKPPLYGWASEPKGRRTLTSDEMSHRQIIATIIGVVVVLVAITAGLAWGCDRGNQRGISVKTECIASGGSWVVGSCVR